MTTDDLRAHDRLKKQLRHIKRRISIYRARDADEEDLELLHEHRERIEDALDDITYS